MGKYESLTTSILTEGGVRLGFKYNYLKPHLVSVVASEAKRIIETLLDDGFRSKVVTMNHRELVLDVPTDQPYAARDRLLASLV